MGRKYILDGRMPVEEVDLLEWAEWLEEADRRVALTTVSEDVKVSTVFSGLDYSGLSGEMMKVFYRIYPGKPDNRPFANGDKGKLVGICLTSFLESCRQAETYIHLRILLDGCPPSWKDAVYHIVRPHHTWLTEYIIADLGGIGNKPSFLKQLEMALDGPDNKFVYFAEDDYLYCRNAVTQMLAFNKVNASFITPYDHPDRYTRGDDRSMRSYVEIVGEWHWRTIESTTMTFGADRRVIAGVYDIIQKHACEGRKMWYPILDRGRRLLWSPMPGLATHVQDGVLAPCVDWKGVWNGNQ